MNSLEPVSVALKFGFLAVLYVFLLWVVRSARRDLRSSSGPDRQQDARALPPDATGLYAASAVGGAQIAERAPRLVVERAPGHDTGMIYDLDSQLVLGRGDHEQRCAGEVGVLVGAPLAAGVGSGAVLGYAKHALSRPRS